MRRVDGTRALSYFDIFPFIETGSLLFDPVPEAYERPWLEACPDTF
jgi:hypothetical protein